MYEGHRIYINVDMSRDLYMKRREFDPIKNKLWEKQITVFGVPQTTTVKMKERGMT